MAERTKIAVLGAGTMGAGMAVQYALYGYEVMLYSRTRATLERAAKTVEKSCGLFAAEGVFPKDVTDKAMELITYTDSVEAAVENAWYVVETVSERADIKKELYQKLDALLPEDVIISSNTSYMNVFELLPERRQPYSLIAHWYAPAQILPLVELVKGPKTLQSVIDKMTEFHLACGKTPICMERYIPGFIVNRLQSAMTREVLFLLENGYCNAEAIDLAVKTSLMPRGLAVGLVERMDFSGIDTVANGLRNKSYSPPPAPGEDNLVLKHAEAGELGVKSGKGFYDYSHKPYEEVLNQRDAQLLKSVKLAKEFMEHPLYKEDK